MSRGRKLAREKYYLCSPQRTMKYPYMFWIVALLCLANWPGHAEATVQHDTIASSVGIVEPLYLAPDPARSNLLADSLRRLITVERGNFMQWLTFAESQQGDIPGAKLKAHREPWILGVFGLMLLFFGVTRAAFPTESAQVVQAFYNDRVLAQVNKEDNLYSSWPFVFLFVLFGFSCGLFLYLVSYQVVGGQQALGFRGFLWISFFVLALFSIKIFVTRMLGIIFEAKRLAREYISVLYLCYFNASLVFIPAILMLSLTTYEHRRYIVWGVLAIVLALFAFRLLKSGSALLEKYRFPKFYLITYLCTLEIVPILILVKVLA